jgi:RNA recognition motif-containing protein
MKVKDKMATKLYIGNMSYDTTEEDLRTLLSGAGTVDTVDIIKDRDTGRPKGFAFVTMSTQAEAEKAISMFNEKTVNDRALTVNIARPREERPSGGGSRFSGGSTHRRRGGSNSRY